MNRRICSLPLVLAAVGVCATLASGQGRVGGSRQALEGTWNSGTATPLERPAGLKDKAFFTPQEAAAFERRDRPAQ